jgi:transcription initiation factor TFIIIB Brf1 subunit/transcription initiation factor TFIIB
MKIRSEFIKANRAIRQIAKECGANPVYVWDIAADEFNIIKGCGCVMDQKQIDAVAEIVKEGLQ